MAFHLKKLLWPIQKIDSLLESAYGKLVEKTSAKWRTKIAKYHSTITVGLLAAAAVCLISALITTSPIWTAALSAVVFTTAIYRPYGTICREIGDNKLFSAAFNAPAATETGSKNSLSSAPDVGAGFDAVNKKDNAPAKAGPEAQKPSL